MDGYTEDKIGDDIFYICKNTNEKVGGQHRIVVFIISVDAHTEHARDNSREVRPRTHFNSL